MAEEMLSISCDQNNPIKVIKWKVREGSTVSIGKVIFLYLNVKDSDSIQHKFKSPKAGILKQIVAPEGAIVDFGELLYWLKLCNHPTIMNDMCAECGADLRNEKGEVVASVPMIHAIPDLKVSEEQAQVIGRADSDRLLRDRKLVLLVDLDQTLIHTTNDNIPANIKDVYHFQLYGPHSPWYHTRLRPGTHEFLENIFPLFELHICTFGTRNYAHMIATFLDCDQKYFSNRILSRDECFDPTSKKANLKALFPCGDNLVCIIDDREDVWSNASNLIHVKPYHFFRHTGDINAPPGLDKQENDERAGVDLSKLKTKNNGKKLLLFPNGLNDNNNGNTEPKSGKNDEVESQSVNKDPEKEDAKFIDEIEHPEHEPSGSKTEVVDETSNNCAIKGGNLEEVNKFSDLENKNIEEAPQRIEKNNEKIEESSVDKNVENLSQGQIADHEKCIQMEPMESHTSIENNQKDNNESVAEVENEEVTENMMKIDAESEVKIDEYSEAVSEIDVEKEKDCKSEIKVDKAKNESTDCKGAKIENDEDNEKKENQNKDKDVINIEDPDYYLHDLERILKQIHKEFYERYDAMESGQVPDLKEVIPLVKGQVLKGTKLYFSGLVPTHQSLEQSKPYLIAKSLGAEVTQDLEEDSTHLVAIRPGTAKVNTGKRRKNLKIVTPDWLWCCAERWEHADERVFPLNSKGSKNRHPPPHCSSPTHVPEYLKPHNPVLRKRTPSGRFMDTINPLMSFSSDDIADMDKEVEDILDDDTDSSEEEDQMKDDVPDIPLEEEENSSSSAESLDTEFPRGYKRTFTDMILAENHDDEEEKEAVNNSDDDEWPSIKFRRGEHVEGLEEWESQDSQNSVDAPDELTDGEWNMMGAALEREFLSND